MLLDVDTVSVDLLRAATATLDGLNEQTGGGPPLPLMILHAKVTLPLSLFAGATVTVEVAVLPALSVSRLSGVIERVYPDIDGPTGDGPTGAEPPPHAMRPN